MLDDLDVHGIAHCSWKSNEHLAAALAGETDLDLLVDHDAHSAFHAVAARHGLKQLVPPSEAAFPGMEHLLGFDRPSGRLFHLHVHYQLVLGEQFVKNHRLPIEREMLRDTRRQDGVRVARPELELAVLVIRALLKYRARDFVKDLLGVRSPGIRDALLTELHWLLDRTDDATVRATLAACSALPTDIVCDFLVATARTRRPAIAYLRLRRRTRSWLGDRARVSRARALTTYGVAVVRRHRRRTFPRMTPVGGGGSLALVGADGAGKSTAACAVAEWLGWKVDTRVAYLGSKPPSRAARATYLAFRTCRRGERALAERYGADGLATRAVRETRNASRALNQYAVGRQRARAYAVAQRDSARGCMVVLDRFPCGTLVPHADGALLDGPQIVATAGPRPNRAVRLLAAAEEHLYGRFPPPDAIVVLDVDPVTAFGRKPDHDPGVLRAKSSAAEVLSRREGRAGPRIRTIDANQSFDRVVSDVKSELWRVV
ncbi:MAG TPA: hypothetical protein VGN51_09235 [Acidimicrobiia bacterium]